MRSWILFGLRIAVSAGLLTWLILQFGGELTTLSDLDPLRLWPAALIFAASTFLGAWQWTLLLRLGGMELGFGRLQRLYWAGLFCNNFLPSSVGGDLLKVADLARSEGRVGRPFAATLLDRLLGLLGLVILGVVAGLVLGGEAPAGVPWWVFGVAALPVLGALTVLLSRRIGSRLVALVAAMTRGKRGARLQGLIQDLVDYRLAPARLLGVLGLAVVVQALRIGTHLAVAWELGLPLGLQGALQLTVIVPMLALAIVLPLSFNGLGLRELVAKELLPAIGVAAETGASWQLATYLVQVAVSLFGGIVFAVELSRGRLLGRRQH